MKTWPNETKIELAGASEASGTPILLIVEPAWRFNETLEPTADSAIFFAQEVSGLLKPQFGGGQL
jgi:hypothetical protein